MKCVRSFDRVSLNLTQPDAAKLSLIPQLFEGFHGRLDRCLGVDPGALEDVDLLYARGQNLQAALNARAHKLGRAIGDLVGNFQPALDTEDNEVGVLRVLGEVFSK